MRKAPTLKVGDKVVTSTSVPGVYGIVELTAVPIMRDCALVQFGDSMDGVCIPRHLLTVVAYPFNTAAHTHLLNNGYTYKHCPADFDDGDPENGPGYGGHDEYDEYTSTDEDVYVGRDGTADHQLVDKEMQEWLADQNDEFGRNR